mmetsp:Transcript_15440/g.53628  ORF Transcript_15440/g.53628 Transcript_15440/m.53628 type:complete len:240 (+) Transcript_15440:630-1349(+)
MEFGRRRGGGAEACVSAGFGGPGTLVRNRAQHRRTGRHDGERVAGAGRVTRGDVTGAIVPPRTELAGDRPRWRARAAVAGVVAGRVQPAHVARVPAPAALLRRSLGQRVRLWRARGAAVWRRGAGAASAREGAAAAERHRGRPGRDGEREQGSRREPDGAPRLHAPGAGREPGGPVRRDGGVRQAAAEVGCGAADDGVDDDKLGVRVGRRRVRRDEAHALDDAAAHGQQRRQRRLAPGA